MSLNNNVVIQNSTIIGSKLFINGEEIELPKSSNRICIVQKNSKVYANGYELVNGKWKRTISALWNYIFV